MPVTLRRRTSVVVFAGEESASDRRARALATSLRGSGVEIRYLGRQSDPRAIASEAEHAGASAIELCVGGGGVANLLRELLRELKRVRRGEVSIVVHRVQ